MDPNAILDPSKVPDLQSAAAGFGLRFIVARPDGWLATVAALVSGLVLSYYATRPLSRMLAKDGTWDGVTGCLLGFVALYLLSGVVTFGKRFSEDPTAALRSLPLLGWFGKEKS